MGKRRDARELALRVLFQVDMARVEPGAAMEASFSEGAHEEEALSFARQLVLGAVQHRDRIDQVINHHARGWTLDRMANIDRNVLRLAIYEILYLPDIPPSVSVDEAVEMAKKYSTAESGRFVNGILGNLLRHLDEEIGEATPA
jgi:N utilization substance protein B